MTQSKQHRWAFLNGCTPAGLARGPWQTLSLPLSFSVHLCGLALFMFGVLLLANDDLEYLFNMSFEDLAIFLLGMLITFISIQLGYVLAALLTTCWGAGVEPWRTSFKRTLGRWYQLTPWHAALLLAFIFVMMQIDEIRYGYYDRYYSTGIHTMLEQSRMDFLIDVAQYVNVSLYFGFNLWLTLATLAVHHDGPRWRWSCKWPAGCEGCGYALAGLDDDHTCPECGKPDRQSKHSERSPIKGLTFALMCEAIFKPKQLGTRLLTRRHSQRPTRALLWSLLAIVIVTPLGIIFVDTASRINGYGYQRSFLEFVEEFVFVGTMIGFIIATCAAVLALTVGSLLATFSRVLAKRNAMPVCCQASCLASGVLPFWLAGNFLLITVVMLIVEAMYNGSTNNANYNLVQLLAPLVILGFNLLMLIYYIWVVDRIMRAARYANV